MTDRLEIAGKILAGFAANPAIFAHNDRCGWGLVNATEEDVAGYALSLADKLIAGEKLEPEPGAKKPTCSFCTNGVIRATGETCCVCCVHEWEEHDTGDNDPDPYRECTKCGLKRPIEP